MPCLPLQDPFYGTTHGFNQTAYYGQKPKPNVFFCKKKRSERKRTQPNQTKPNQTETERFGARAIMRAILSIVT